MRFDIRLHGSTEQGKDCVMDFTIYAGTQQDFERQVEKSAQEGPWFYKGGHETVAESEKITVLHVQRLVDGKWV